MTEPTPIATPAADLASLEPLVGVWEVQGGAAGRVEYRWLDGGHFLVQSVQLEQEGQVINGLEVIGHTRPFGQDPDPILRSRFYDNQGNTLDYVYRLEGDKLTIWAGEEGSPVRFEGTLSHDGNTLRGEWDYAGHGGYASEMTRVDQPKG